MSRLKAIQNYVLVRLLLAPLMIWTIVTLVFLLLRIATGDPVDAILGNRAPEFAKENLREILEREFFSAFCRKRSKSKKRRFY